MKTRDVLAQRGVPFTERELVKQPLSADELRALAALRPPGEWFSWGSRRARAEGWQPDQLADADLIRLMSEDPTLIKRPLVRVGDRLIAGHDPARLDEAIGSR